ncbi:MAG: hypothetical protein P8L77_02455 [Gammaproteobacteria bacterium]|nr:hypothetical protein [Gammaproteobacteria bacterium]
MNFDNHELLNIRKLRKDPNVRIIKSDLCQQVDIILSRNINRKNICLENPINVLSYKSNLDNYQEDISKYNDLGIFKFNLHPIKTNEMSVNEYIDLTCELLIKLKQKDKSNLLFVDILGMALNDDLTFGIKDHDGRINYDNTYQYIYEAARLFSDAGCDEIITVGRLINCKRFDLKTMLCHP